MIEWGGGRGLWEVTLPEGATAVEGETASEPDQYGLEQNYPNPFNPSTTIEYRVGQAAQVELVIFDIAGQKVRTLVSGSLAAGVILPCGRPRRQRPWGGQRYLPLSFARWCF